MHVCTCVKAAMFFFSLGWHAFCFSVGNLYHFVFYGMLVTAVNLGTGGGDWTRERRWVIRWRTKKIKNGMGRLFLRCKCAGNICDNSVHVWVYKYTVKARKAVSERLWDATSAYRIVFSALNFLIFHHHVDLLFLVPFSHSPIRYMISICNREMPCYLVSSLPTSTSSVPKKAKKKLDVTTLRRGERGREARLESWAFSLTLSLDKR